MTYYNMIDNKNLKAVFVAILAFGLASCGGESDEKAKAEDVSSESQASEPAQTDEAAQEIMLSDDFYSAENYKDGISFGDLSMGDPNAPLTVIEYASFTCGHCADFSNKVLPDFERDYIQTGKVRMIFRNYVRDQYDIYASMIARCNEPKKAFALTSLFFKHQSTWLNQDFMDKLAGLARRAGMSRASVDACIANTELQKSLIEMQANGAKEFDIAGTPTFVINGKTLTGPRPEEFIKAINDAL